MPNLEDAILLAANLHKGQTDKAGEPYILHPLRVMLRVLTPDEQIVAVLHDVLEDCDITLDDLRYEGYSETVLQALDTLTKRTEEHDDYDAFVRRVASGPLLARKVKLADLADNMDITRLADPSEEDQRRMDKYQRAKATIEGTLSASSGVQQLSPKE